MFNPTRDQVRAFFRDTWQKYSRNAPLEGLETTAIGILLDHPEYHALLGEHASEPLSANPETPTPNAFLHLSMHLALEEQYGIDQPAGVRSAIDALRSRLGVHEAMHAAMESLGEMMWTAQRNGTAPDADTYLDSLRRRASRR